MDEIREAPPAFVVHHLFNEETTVEREIIGHLKSKPLGWTYRSREQIAEFREDDREVLLLPPLRAKLKALNPGVLTDEARVDAIVTKLRACRDNRQWLAWLKDGVNYQFDPSEKTKDVRLIDYDNLEANDWWVTNQFPVEGISPRRPDMVLLINGIPVVVIEAKTASRSKPDWREGAKQLGMYSQEIDQLFYTNAYGVGVNETRMMYGVPGRRLQFWLQWRDPWPHEIDEFDEMKVSLYGLFDRANLLDFIRHFIVFMTKDGKTEKVVVRYQQYQAVHDILGRATELALPPEKRRGLIWHTQGSGKTLTMIYAARSLWEDKRLNSPTVILLVDREQLGDQMDRELQATGTDNVHAATSKRDLEAKLAGDYRGVILTTVHLFEGMPKRITRDRANVIVMADEAHRTQERELGTYMRSAVEGASLFGFTGTPIERDDHNTPLAWGQHERRRHHRALHGPPIYGDGCLARRGGQAHPLAAAQNRLATLWRQAGRGFQARIRSPAGGGANQAGGRLLYPGCAAQAAQTHRPDRRRCGGSLHGARPTQRLQGHAGLQG